MKNIISLLVLFISFYSFSQTIEWNWNNKLTKTDFQGKIPEDTINHAGTAFNIGYEIISNSIWTGKIKIRTYAIFDKSKSWLNQTFYTDALLNHEQKHFDIAKIYACKLQEEINSEIKNSKDFNNKIDELSKKIGEECIAFQNKYDLETDHGTILEIQNKYDNLIKEMVEKYNYR